MKRHLGLGGLELEAGIPGTALGTIEAGSERMWMAERGIDDRRVGHRGEQFLGSDSGRQAALREQPLVGGIVELEYRSQVLVVVGNASEDTVPTGQVPGGYEAMGVSPADVADWRTGHEDYPARRASSRRRTLRMAGSPPWSM